VSDDPYSGREQTKAKHYILKRYLQALAFKVLTFTDITFVDGFSGPWKCQTEDFADSSFMIALEVLKDAQEKLYKATGRRRNVCCFFVEKDREAYARLDAAVVKFNKPEEDFEVKTYCGEFESAIPEILVFIGRSFPLIFIDPTGWTGYSIEKLKRLCGRPKVELLINFMYDFINRAVGMSDPATVASIDPILGGPGWQERLDTTLKRGPAVEKLFRETLAAECDLDYVVSTKIYRSTKDRPHFFMVYATKAPAGLETFRDTEYSAVKAHARERANAKERKREEESGTASFFTGLDADLQEASIDDVVAANKKLGEKALIIELREAGGQMRFAELWPILLRAQMLRVTDVKDICKQLAKEGLIENTWGSGNRKP
jgi:three-Cys-motif partner protein